MAAPKSGTQIPGWYRFLLGDFECTVLWDGYIDHAYEGFYPNADPQEIARLKRAYCLPAERFPMDLNPVVVNTGSQLILIDAGMGPNRPLFGAGMGHLMQNLAAAGLCPGDIDLVLLTHLHPDHAFGLILSDGAAAFPNAALCVPRADWAEWVESDNLAREDFRKVWTEGLLEALAPYRDRIRFTAPGETPCPGVSVLSGAGHSLGQCIYIFESRGEAMMFTGDVTHHHVFDPHHPEWFFHDAYDSDPVMAAETKARVFAHAADGKIRVHGYHFPYPGIGVMSRAEDGSYRFIADPLSPRLGPGRFGMA